LKWPGFAALGKKPCGDNLRHGELPATVLKRENRYRELTSASRLTKSSSSGVAKASNQRLAADHRSVSPMKVIANLVELGPVDAHRSFLGLK